MKLRFLSCLLASLLAAGVSFAQVTPKTAPMKGVVRVKLQPQLIDKLPEASALQPLSGGILQVGIAPMDVSLRKIGGMRMRPVFPCAPDRAQQHALFGLDLWYEIAFDESVDPLEARHILAETPGVTVASVRVPMSLKEGTEGFRVAPAPAALPAGDSRAATLPFNDPRLSQQWHYHNDGSLAGSVPRADINLFKAWEITTGSPNVVVAIIDGGVDYNHEDLHDHMWVNQAELNGRPGVDDDGDGFIDDIYGFNFCTHDGTIYPHDHGTHVAGTVSAVNNNGIGVCGVAGGDGRANSGVRLMSCQVFDPRTGTPRGDFAGAIVYAADKGATIAQCSWGWDDDGYYEQDVLDAVRYFTATARSNNMTGGLCIFASGNTSTEGMFYPACMDEVLSVAAMTCELRPSNFSSFGSWVDVVAPGGYMDFDSSQGIMSTLPNNNYGFNEGTSMACPHVSGIAALILSKYGSPTLINESVRQQILTSVNDFYTKNPTATGLFGSGYVDAYKALQWGDGTAPAAVSDLQAAASQESVTLSWTIPASTAGSVNSHIIYYSDKPFTAATLSTAKTVIVDTKFLTPGEAFDYEITGLAPITTYYFAVQAVDRWSNASPLSAIVEATTNAGPKMTLNRSSMTIYTTNGTDWTHGSFVIGNDDEGLLKWSLDRRTASSVVKAFSAPKELMTVPFSGRLGVQPLAADASRQVILAEYTQNDYPKQMRNYESLYAYIGDAATSNSMAQLFTVDKESHPDGFHLTHVSMVGMYGKNPTIEIYRNTGTLGNASLLETFRPSENVSVYGYDHPLPEAIYFAPGESFYVVVHFTEFETRNYPLGFGMSNGSNDASHSYMSTDLGKTWSRLTEALRGSAYENLADKGTWCITAQSKFPDWSQALEINPTSGQVKKGEKQTVTVYHADVPLPNGTYRSKVFFNTNETEKNNLYVNVTMSVEGMAPDVTCNKVIQFGNLLVGQTKTISVEVFNKGYGAFAGGATYAGIFEKNIEVTNKNFKGPEYMQNGIPARSTATVDLTYAPTEAGSHSGVVILRDKDGRELRFNVAGSATEPAKMVVEPETIAVGDLPVESEGKDVTFTVRNDGKYPLQFVMPKFSDEEMEEVASSSTHRFGYSWNSNLYGGTDVVYGGAPELIDAVDVKGQFGDYNYFTEPIDIGFQFPFYGKTYEQVYISSLGTLSFKPYNEGSIYSPLYESSFYIDGMGVISVYGSQFEFGPNSRVEYAHQDGRFVVNYKNVLVTVYANETTPASFHIALSPSGDIEMAFDDYVAERVFQQGSPLWVGIVDPATEDPLTVTSSRMIGSAVWYGDTAEPANRWRHVKTGSTFRFYAPKPNMIASVKPAAGIVSPGDKMTVTARVKATDEMYAGAIYNDLVIQSNDMQTPIKLVRFNANVTGDLQPVFDLTTTSLDFGRVFRTAVAHQSVGVQNRGRSALTLQSVSVAGGRFTHNFTTPVEVPAGQSRDIVVTLPTTNEGAVSDVLTIQTSAGTKTVALQGTVIGAPQLELGYTSLTETLPSGESKARPLTVRNAGNEPLVYSILPGNHISYQPEYTAEAKTHYIYTSSLDDPTAARPWVDIETNGLGRQFNYTYFLNHDLIGVDLPFEFTFYNKKYSRIYIYNAGFVSFTQRNDDAIWPEPPGEFPAGTVYNNLIAPYWGLHTMDITSTAGIYYYVDEEQAVVSFIEYGNSMNIGVDFQVVLRKDGTFTFNYKAANAFATIFAPFGVSGISDENNEGICLPSRYLALGSTTNFTPVVEHTLAPGEAQTADVTVKADDLAGNYTGGLTLQTNVPTQPTVSVPLHLTITGEPQPVFPDNITVEQVAGYLDNNLSDELIATYGALWYVPLEVGNTGTSAFTITGIDVESAKVQGVSLFSLYHYGEQVDPDFGTTTHVWRPYTGGRIDVGRTTQRFAIPLMQGDYSEYAWQTPGTYTTRLTFHLSGVQGVTTRTVTVTCRVTEQPTIAVDREEIHVEGVESNFVGNEALTLSNVNGKHTLQYTITVDPTGVGEQVVTRPGMTGIGCADDIIPGRQLEPQMADSALCLQLPEATMDDSCLAPWGRITTYDVGTNDNIYDCPDPNDEDFPYLRALYWPAHPTNKTAYDYGSETTYGVYKAATGFVGPEGGFNVTHVYFAMNPYNLSHKDVLVEIVNGDPQVDYDVIGRATFNLGEVTATQDYQNQLYIATLERPVYVSEGQRFYVVITFPTGQKHPAMIISKQEAVVSNRYLGWVDSYGWFDLAALFEKNYGSLGYLTSCLETVEGDAWAKMLDPVSGQPVSTLTGEIAPGATQQLQVRFNAAVAPKETGNKAVLIIKSNDPKRSLINLPVYLDKNASPTVSVAGSNLLVNEGERLEVSVTVADVDGDDFTFSVDDDIASVSILSCQLQDEAAGGTATVAADKMSVSVKGNPAGAVITLQLAPGYGVSGQHTLHMRAVDQHGHVNDVRTNFTVSHVNRAPEATKIPDLYIQTGTLSGIVKLENYFTDPDGDAITYDITISDARVAQLFRSGNDVFFNGLKQGNARAEVTATDAAGAQTVVTFKVLVRNDLSAIESLNGDVAAIWTDAPGTTLYVATGEARGNVQLTLCNMAGQVVKSETYQAQPSVPHTLSLASLPAATYVVRVATADGQTSQLIVKP